MISAIKTHAGQYRPYDDTFYEWDLISDEKTTPGAVLDWCFANLPVGHVPPRAEWRERVRYGGDKQYDMAYYFAGYHELRETDIGHRYHFTICKPYTD